MNRITTIIVNYKTHALTQVCYESFRRFYPDVEVFLVDNYSRDDSTEYIYSLWDAGTEHLTCVFVSTNVGHGPAMARMIEAINTPFVFTLDSDCEILRGGLLENMLQEMDNNGNLYATGWLRWVDRHSGVPHAWHVDHPPKGDKFIPYIHPHAALYRLSMYNQLRPFFDHGAPCLNNMLDVETKEYDLKAFELKGYVKHWIAGTRRMWDGAWHPKDNKRPKKWIANQNLPI